MAGDNRSEIAGVLAKVTSRLPGGGEERPGQLEMAAAVARAIETGRHLAVQAGTGTGKSLAYLIPAALSGRKIVVATATKALQDQLALRDLPLLQAVLGNSFQWSVLKGRNNYLCRQRAAEVSGHGFQAELALDLQGGSGIGQLEGDDPWSAAPAPAADTADTADALDAPNPEHLADQLRWLLRWSAQSETGDRADLPFEPLPRAWQMLSVGPRECPGAYRCASGPHCFAESARDAAASADVLVANLHLYGAHIASGGVVLPPHDVAIFDEAHQLEDVMTASLGVELTPGRLRAVGLVGRPLLQPGQEQAAQDVLDIAQRLLAILGQRVGTRVDDDEELSALLGLAAPRVRSFMERLRLGHHAAGRQPAERSVEQDGQRERAINAASHIADDLARLDHDHDGHVLWVDGSKRSPVLRASPIDVGAAMLPLWDEVTAVMTSATVPPRLRERLHISIAGSDELDVGSPFDYHNHAVLYVARHLPDRRRTASDDALHDELERLITAAGGRTLALFTSYRALDTAVEALRPRIEKPQNGLAVRLMRQGDLPKGRLLEQFVADETSCLFATLGFWQGIDVPGPSLTLVCIDRIPFPRPDEPVLQARRDMAGAAAFGLIDLPRAATMLAQGSGRLIRTATDTGVIAVLDPRLATAGYRRVLLAKLPPMRRTTEHRQVADFLGRVLAASGAPAETA